MAKRDDMEIWFEDECHFQQHGSRCVMWVPPEETDPVVLHAPTRKSVGVFGAVAVTGKFVFSRELRFNGETFLPFLQQLVRHKRRGKKMIVVLDNARWHHAKFLKPWLEKNKRHIALDFLPPYSPDLNHIERVWKVTRRMCTHNCYFPSVDELFQSVCNQFEQWRKNNKTLAKLIAIT